MLLSKLEMILDKLFSKSKALKWDNVGLQVGSKNKEIKNILVTLDANDNCINEAIEKNSDLIFAHHPLIFEPLKTIVDTNHIQGLVKKLIENNIALYCAHTNYDLMDKGLNDFVANKMGLNDIKVLQKNKQQWYKFVVFVPQESEEIVRNTICANGGGNYKDYSCCTFNVKGTGTFKPLEGATPYSGKVGELNFEKETKIECIVSEDDLNNLIKEVIKIHPYEEVAYDVFKIENQLYREGIGRIGKLEQPLYFNEFLLKIKDELEVRNFKWVAHEQQKLKNKKVEKVALICGSANSLKENITSLNCDVVLVGELDYHNALDIINSGKIVIELGHGNSEKYAIDDIYNKLSSYFKNKKIKILKSKMGYTVWRYYID